ncbi:MAG: transglutaminase family protein, partial [Chromatiaceae bacterium]
MSIHVAINHKTEYRFDRAVGLSPHVVRLRPALHCRTPILSYTLKISPEKHFINWQQDPFGNYLARLVFPEKAGRLTVEVDVIAEIITINPFDFFLEEYAYKYPFQYDAQLRKELAPYMEIKEDGPLLKDWLSGVDRTPRETVYFLVDLNKKLQEAIGYVIRMEPGIQTCEHTLATAKGSCRDTGWLLVQILRHLGLAARFVSGYLVQLTPDVKSLDGPSGPERDFTDLHAWAEVYAPGAGWIGLDPTSGLFAGEGHIPLACTPDPSSAAPITGTTEPCEVELYFHNRVERIHEDPRVTKPYTDEQWQAIQNLGHNVDRELAENDVRLTMGGEPTFVSVDDMDGEEWNTAALGPTKKLLAEDLLRRLKDRFAPGGLLHIGHGKWYPGEPLPRWALSCYWRKDGAPVWRNPALFADERDTSGHGAAHAERFIRALAERLEVRPEHALPAYEDVFYYLWKEARLPTNVDPLDNKLKDPLERKRLTRLFQQGLNAIAGYVLPLRWWGLHPNGGWISGRWAFRDGNLFLIPGDSPMGLRLPLDALPYVPEAGLETEPERNPFEPREPLTSPFDELARRYGRISRPDEAPQRIREQGPNPQETAQRYE